MPFQHPSVGKFAATAVLALCSASAFAQSAGDTLVHAGWFHVMPKDSSSPLRITSPIQTTIPGSGATVEDVDTPGFSITRFLTNNWAVTFDLGVPPRYKLNGTGSLATIGRIGTARQWAPAFLGKYYFGEATAKLRPSVGLGFTRVHYTNIELTDSLQRYTRGLVLDNGAVTTADIDSSWAPIFNAGLGYQLSDRWYLNFSLSYLRLRTTANLTTTKTNSQQFKSTATVDINPLVSYVNLAYRF